MFAAFTKLLIKYITVIGPTPPGTGVITDIIPFKSSNLASPVNPSAVLLILHRSTLL